jgi:peptide/nickel transport system substrate-binding protein
MLSRRGLVLSSAVLATAGHKPAAAATKELRFRLVEDPEMLWSGQSVSLTVNTVVGTYLVERLVYQGTDGKPQPWLAERWSFSDDAKQITFTLRPGIKFHDGTDLDAAAVKFHFDSILDPARASPVRPIISALESVDALDPLTVRFNFSRPFAPFMNLIGGGAYGINSPTAVQRLGRQYGRRPVGSGPYRFVSWSPGSEIVFERNPNYRQLRADAVNKGAPYADRITLSVIPEEGVAFSALQTRELSAAELQTDTVERLARDRNFRVVIDENAKNLAFLEFAFRPPFDDVRMREAVSYALDRAAIVRAAYAGYAVEVRGPMSRGIPGYDEAVAQQYGTAFDPARARAILADLGWTDPGRRGVLSKDGREARFALRSYANPVVDRALAVIQRNLADVGIAVTITTSDWGSFYPSLLREGWDMNYMRWTSFDPFVLVQLFRHPGHRRALPRFDGLDDALAGIETTLDPERRQVFVSEAQKLLLQHRAIVPLMTNHNVTIVQAGLQNYVPDVFNLIKPGDLRMANW